MSGSGPARAVLFVESNTSGTGGLFARTAARMGYRPVLVTTRPEKYAYLAGEGAPEVVVVPRVDEEALDEVVREWFSGGAEIAGVTSSSEYFIPAAAALAARLGLPGPDPARVRDARDKSHQREVLATGGVPSPRFRVVGSPGEAARAADDFGPPVVVKPLRGSGSVGVRACADAGEASRQAAHLLTAPDGGGRVLVESLVDGAEFSVEVFGGRVVGITRKHLGRLPHFVETGHDHPAAVEPEVARALEDSVTRGTALLGLGWGPAHWELRVRDGRAVPIEVNPRLAGGFIPELVRHAQGVDLIRETLRLVVGETPELDPVRRRFASIRFLFAPVGGRLARVEGVREVRGAANVVDVALYRSPGDTLELHGDFRDRIGHVVACADAPDDAASSAERALASLRVRVGDAAKEPV